MQGVRYCNLYAKKKNENEKGLGKNNNYLQRQHLQKKTL